MRNEHEHYLLVIRPGSERMSQAVDRHLNMKNRKNPDEALPSYSALPSLPTEKDAGNGRKEVAEDEAEFGSVPVKGKNILGATIFNCE